MTELRQRLGTCFAAVFPKLSKNKIPRATLVSVSGWDSLATVTLIAIIEEEFGVQVLPEDMEHFVSFEHILGYLQEKAGVNVS